MGIIKMSATQIAQLNKSNKAAQNAYLGSRLAASASHIVTSAEASASGITIQTALPNVTTGIVQVYRSGSQVNGVKCTTTGSNLNIASGSPSWVIAAADVIVYTAIP